MPVGVQVIGMPYEEEKVLGFMSLLESKIDFYTKHPLPKLHWYELNWLKMLFVFVHHTVLTNLEQNINKYIKHIKMIMVSSSHWKELFRWAAFSPIFICPLNYSALLLLKISLSLIASTSVNISGFYASLLSIWDLLLTLSIFQLIHLIPSTHAFSTLFCPTLSIFPQVSEFWIFYSHSLSDLFCKIGYIILAGMCIQDLTAIHRISFIIEVFLFYLHVSLPMLVINNLLVLFVP